MVASVRALDVVLDAPLEVGVVVGLHERFDLCGQVGLVRLVRLGFVRLGLVRLGFVRLRLVRRGLVSVVLAVLRLRLSFLTLDLNWEERMRKSPFYVPYSV